MTAPAAASLPQAELPAGKILRHNPIHRGSGPLRNGNRRGNPALAPRCGAKTRAGCPCRAPAVRGHLRCRMHGGRSTGPRTEAGLARMRAAKTVHGQYSAVTRAAWRQDQLMLRRARVLAQAAGLWRWLPAELARRLWAGAPELLTPAWEENGATTPCTVEMAKRGGNARRVLQGRAADLAVARRESAALAPWRAAIAAAKLARRAPRNPGNDPVQRGDGAALLVGDGVCGAEARHGCRAFARHDVERAGNDPVHRGDEDGQLIGGGAEDADARRGSRTRAPHDVEKAGNDPMRRGDDDEQLIGGGVGGADVRRGGQACARHDMEKAGNNPVHRGRSWSRGWKGELCAGTYFGSAAGYIARHGGWLRAFGAESWQALEPLWRASVALTEGHANWLK